MTLLGVLQIVVVLAIIGFAVWLVTTYIPMPDAFQKVIIVVVVLALLIWVVTVLLGGNLSLGKIPGT
jgi:hypothetical protein